nr:C6 transcription factor [Colletotrichum truncatum]KAF6787946.1 C6 transcription factor [Colletotrichum truncatum]
MTGDIDDDTSLIIDGSDRHYEDEEMLSPPTTISPGPATNASELSVSSDVAKLQRFRSRMLPKFPFIHLSTEVTAEKLQLDRPFLFRAITCVASLPTHEKREHGHELKRVLSGLAFFHSEDIKNHHESMEKTTDLLLGLLVFIAWGWDHVIGGRSLSRLMMLALSLVGEMHLDKPTAHQSSPLMLSVASHDKQDDERNDELAKEKLMERRRTVLGCFALSSMVSTHFGEIEPLTWTPQMEEDLAAIAGDTEYPSDMVLAVQVRLQLLALQAAQSCKLEMDQVGIMGLPPPTILHTRDMLMRLQEIRTFISSKALPDSKTLMGHTYFTELRILEAAKPDITVSSGIPCAGPSNASVSLQSDHTFCLWKAQLAVKNFATALLALTPSCFLYASFLQAAQWTYLANCVAILCRAGASFGGSEKDPAIIRAIAELPVMLGRLVDIFQLAANESGESESDGVFASLADSFGVFCRNLQSQETGNWGEPGPGLMTSTSGFDGNIGSWIENFWAKRA